MKRVCVCVCVRACVCMCVCVCVCVCLHWDTQLIDSETQLKHHHTLICSVIKMKLHFSQCCHTWWRIWKSSHKFWCLFKLFSPFTLLTTAEDNGKIKPEIIFNTNRNTHKCFKNHVFCIRMTFWKVKLNSNKAFSWNLSLQSQCLHHIKCM